MRRKTPLAESQHRTAGYIMLSPGVSAGAIVVALLLVAGSTLLSASPNVTGRSGTGPRFRIHYGWVDVSLLSDFGPRELDGPNKILREKNLVGAAAAFHQYLAGHPDSLPAFIGLAQCDRTWRNQTDRELRVSLAKTPRDPLLRFRLGALEYYAWQDDWVTPGEDTPRLVYAESLIIPAWYDTRLPIMGMLKQEVIGYNGVYLAKHPDSDTDVNQWLLGKLAGPAAYARYLQAKRVGWNAPPPPFNLTPRENLRPLRGVLRTMRSISTSTSRMGKMVNGKIVWDGPAKAVVPAGQAWFRYLTAWNDEINQEEGD